MNDINNSMTFGDDYAAGLTKYDNNGLILYIHKDGQVYWTQSAGAKMLNMEQGHLSNYMNRNAIKDITFSPVLHAQLPTAKGLQGHNIYSVATLVTLAKKYNPNLADKFMEMGANVYLYQLAGYKVNVQPTFEMSEHEKNERLLDAMTQKVAIGNYAKARPNFQAKIDFIVANKGAIGGKMTLDEFNTAHGYIMTVGQKMAVGRGMSEVTRKETGTTPTRRNIKVYKEGVKSYTIRQVCEYDVSLTPEYISLCGQRGIG